MKQFLLTWTILFCIYQNVGAQGKKCLVELALSVTDSQGNPVSGTFSLSVTDVAVVKPDTIQPMLDSYMLLNSELKGNIENPNYYFKAPDRRTAHHLDLLMMTQGWRRYMLEDMVSGTYPDITHSIETGQTISGEVKGTMGNKVRNVNLHLVTPHIGRLDTIPLNNNRRFTITGLDFTDGTTFLLQAIRKSGKHGLIELEVDSICFNRLNAPVWQEHTKALLLPETFRTQARTQIMYAGADGITELPEVVKTGMKLRKPMNMLKAMPDKWLTDDDPYLNSAGSLQAILTRLGITSNKVQESWGLKDVGLGKIYIDNMPDDDPDLINLIRPENIAAIEYFRPGHSAMACYGWGAVKWGALFIYTKYADYGPPLSMKSITPKGYKPEVEFYSPQYPAKDKTIYTRPDHRTTLYWNPCVTTDEEGKASVSFYSSDVSKKYLVTVEGISEEGMMVSEAIRF